MCRNWQSTLRTWDKHISGCNIVQWQIFKQSVWIPEASQRRSSGNATSYICMSGHPSIFIPLLCFCLAWISSHEGRMPYTPPSLNSLKPFDVGSNVRRDQEIKKRIRIQEIKLSVMSVRWIWQSNRKAMLLALWYGCTDFSGWDETVWLVRWSGVVRADQIRANSYLHTRNSFGKGDKPKGNQ